ncbi:hypothetical protein GWC77_26950 [Paraburkholderia sp. NMBU_R16]|uniref:hypothetical protein n=1 Tax=Paraburkholderia sp. NMBU_R16 TaxID=2698676 RepID=UPI001565D5BD|nr:hypothetical protein [Paraburkholderia sp. NMBU_R16]NRO99514.1 hypothetical protein [Paraburkholderia sp. NMBU_R16]
MEAIKTIAVDVPKKTNYYAFSAGTSPVMFIGPGVLVAAVTGAISGAISAASHRTNPTFNDLVTEKLGDTGLNRKFLDALESQLRAEGYEIKEVELAQGDMPQVVLKDRVMALDGKSYTGADAIMIVQNLNGYYAPGSMSWYTRDVKVNIEMFKADTFEPIFQDRLKFNQGISDPYHYTTFSELKDDLPRAIKGLDEAVMGLVPQFRADLLASRGVSAATAQAPKTSATPETSVTAKAN